MFIEWEGQLILNGTLQWNGETKLVPMHVENEGHIHP